MVLDPGSRPVVSYEELAAMTGVGASTLRAWSRERGMPVYKVGGRVLIVWEDFLSWLREFPIRPEVDLYGGIKSKVERILHKRSEQ